MKNQKGITLVALIITIIVMLILVAVTLSIVLGDNGIIKKGQEASNSTKYSQEVEKSIFNDNQIGDAIDGIANGTNSKLTINTADNQVVVD